MSAGHARRMAPRLSALRDGDLGGLRAALLRRHVARCAGCQAVLADLEAQVAALRALRSAPADEAQAGAAEEAGWLALERALRSAPTPAPAPAWRAWLRPAPAALAALGAAAAGALLVTQVPSLRARLSRGPSDEVIVSQAEAEFREAELHYQRAIAQLLRVSARARAGWSQPEVRAYEARLMALRAATEQRRARALSRPADADAQEELYAAYRDQIAFLQQSLRRRQGAVVPVVPVGFEGAAP